MAGTNHYTAVCSIKVKLGDKTTSGEREIDIGPGTAYPFVTAVEINRMFKDTGQLSLTIDAPFYEGRELLNSPIFYTGNTLEVTLRYPDDDDSIITVNAVMFKGGVGLTLTPNGISGTITARCVAQSAETVTPVVALPTEPTFSWLERIITDSGYTALNASDRIKETVNTIQYVSNEVVALFDRFRDFCEANHLIWIEDPSLTEVTIIDEEDLDKGDVKRVFVMRNSFVDTAYLKDYDFLEGRLQANPKVYPIVSYAPEIPAAFFTNAEGVKIVRTGINKEGRREVQTEDENTAGVKATTKSTDEPIGAVDIKAGDRQTVTAMEDGAAAEVITNHHPEADDRAADENRHRRATQGRMAAYNANLTTFGIPEIEPGERVAVVGLGDLFDGIFMVKEVTQSWSAGSIETSIGIYGRNAGVES
jgi:hypothetical protein